MSNIKERLQWEIQFMVKLKTKIVNNDETTEFKNLAVFVIINKRVKSIYEVIVKTIQAVSIALTYYIMLDGDDILF